MIVQWKIKFQSWRDIDIKVGGLPVILLLLVQLVHVIEFAQ